jgi:hypothetical protein
MDTERDVTRIVQSWLRTDEHESADRVLDNVLALLDATPQRRSWWPARRNARMNATAKLATVAAAVAAVALIAIIAMPRGSGGIGGPTPSSQAASPSSSMTAQPSPSSTTAAAHPKMGELAIGRHSLTREGRTFSIALRTEGWFSNGEFGIDKGDTTEPDAAGFIVWTETPDGVYTDPCGQVQGPPVAKTASALAAAVSKVPGIRLLRGPESVTVGGYPAQKLVITVPASVPCKAGPNGFHLWYSQVAGGRWATALDSTIYTWIIDVDGAIIWIDGETYKDSGPAVGQEVEQIVDSIQFE